MEIRNMVGTVIREVAGETLRGADLSGAGLHLANLRGKDLHGASLRGVDLDSADLRGADLTGADLRGAYLSGTNFQLAKLRCAQLGAASITGANFKGASLGGAILRDGGSPLTEEHPLTGDTGYSWIAWREADGVYLRFGCMTYLLAELTSKRQREECRIHDRTQRANLARVVRTVRSYFAVARVKRAVAQ